MLYINSAYIVICCIFKGIGFKRYSLLGWSDGGISSMILSAKYPQCVNKLVVWGANAYVIPSEIETYESEFVHIPTLLCKTITE